MSATIFRTWCFLGIATLLALIQLAGAGEFTFELPDNEKMCFYEFVKKGVECVLEYQVTVTLTNDDNGKWKFNQSRRHTRKKLVPETGTKICIRNLYEIFDASSSKLRPNPKIGVPANLNQTHLNLFTSECLIYFWNNFCGLYRNF